MISFARIAHVRPPADGLHWEYAYRTCATYRLADHRCHRRRPAPLLRQFHHELRQSGHDHRDGSRGPAQLRGREPKDLMKAEQLTSRTASSRWMRRMRILIVSPRWRARASRGVLTWPGRS